MRRAALGHLLSVVLLLTVWSTAAAPAAAADLDSNQCVACHTNLKPLIRLSWEVEKVKPALKTSTENAGEG